MRASAPGASSAAATPCSTRKSASWTGDWANAHSALPSGEAGDAEEVDAPAAEPVPERTADEDQRGQAEQVAVGDPLQLGQRGVEVGADLAQRDVDDGAVQHRDAGAERDRGQGEPAARRSCRSRSRSPGSSVGAAQLHPEARWTFVSQLLGGVRRGALLVQPVVDLLALGVAHQADDVTGLGDRSTSAWSESSSVG